MIRKQEWIRFLRYSTVGVLTFGLDLCILYVLTEVFHVFYLYAIAVGFTVGITVNYTICRPWVFKHTERTLHLGYWYFVGAGFVALLVILSSVGLLVGTFGVPLFVARVIVSGIVGYGNYLMNLYWNFKVVGKDIFE